MTTSSLRQLYSCSTVGCRALLVAPGRCFNCGGEIEAIDRDFENHCSPALRSEALYLAGAILAVALMGYVFYQFAVMFADWILGGGRPWL